MDHMLYTNRILNSTVNLTKIARSPQVTKLDYILNFLYPLPSFISHLLWWRQSFNFQYNSFLIQSLCSVFNVSTVYLFLSLLLLGTRRFPGDLGNGEINQSKVQGVTLPLYSWQTDWEYRHRKSYHKLKMLSVWDQVALPLTIWKTCCFFFHISSN